MTQDASMPTKTPFGPFGRIVNLLQQS